jgi:hypothetical protein
MNDRLSTPDPSGLPGVLKTVVFDAPDHRGLAQFYAHLTGGDVRYADDGWATVFTGDGWRLGFQSAPDLVPVQWPGQERPQQLHMDFQVADLGAATAAAERLGARQIGAGDTWNVLADPAGHPFDLCANEQDVPFKTFAVNIDCPDGEPLSAFYARLLGMKVKYSQDKMAWIGGDEPAPMGDVLFQPVSDYHAPAWPDPARPQQLHLDIVVPDIDAAERAAVAIGATRLPGEGENWHVFADPDGHPFCLLWEV